MYPANAYVIRQATAHDAQVLTRLAMLDSRPRLADGRILIGEIDGGVAAALSLEDGRAIANPFQHTERLVTLLRLRAGALHAVEDEPSLRERVLAGLRRGPSVQPNPAG